MIKTPKRSHWRRFGVFIVNSEHISHRCSSVSVVNFEQVNAELGIHLNLHNSRNEIWKQYLSIHVCVRSCNSICESNYRISSNKHSRHLCNFEALGCGAWRKEGSPLKERGAYFEVWRVIIMKFSGIFMVNFEHISHLVLVFLELTLNM